MRIGEDVLWLSEVDVQSLLSMKEGLEAVEEAFRLHGSGEVQLPAKIYLDFAPFEGDLRAMPAYVKGKVASAGVKIVNSNPRNPERGLPAVSGIMILIDPETGLPMGVFGAGFLTSLRTGAAGGIAAKYLARPASTTVGLIGCGRQAATQLEALLELFKIKRINVWGKTNDEISTFIRHHPGLGKKLVPCSDVKIACDADILVTTTPVRSPIVKAEWIRAGTHINAIGADAPGKQEIESSLLRKSRVVVDEWIQASHAGEINVAVHQGVFSEKDLAGQLGEIIIGKKKGRVLETDITIFDSTGLALQDVAVARRVYEKALKTNKGQVLKFNG